MHARAAHVRYPHRGGPKGRVVIDARTDIRFGKCTNIPILGADLDAVRLRRRKALRRAVPLGTAKRMHVPVRSGKLQPDIPPSWLILHITLKHDQVFTAIVDQGDLNATQAFNSPRAG